MTINNTKHIVMDEDDIKSAIVDYLFRTNLIEVEREHITFVWHNDSAIDPPELEAKINVPIQPGQLINLQEDSDNG